MVYVFLAILIGLFTSPFSPMLIQPVSTLLLCLLFSVLIIFLASNIREPLPRLGVLSIFFLKLFILLIFFGSSVYTTIISSNIDHYAYTAIAEQYGRFLAGYSLELSNTHGLMENPLYWYVSGFSYSISGFNPLASPLLNIFLSAVTLLVLFMVLEKLRAKSSNTFFLFFLYPSLFAFSLINTKDTLLLFFLSLVIWQVLQKNYRYTYLLAVGVFLLRFYVGAFVFFSILFVHLDLRHRLSGKQWAAIAILLLVLFFTPLSSPVLQKFSYWKNTLNTGNTKVYNAPVDLSTPLHFMLYLPEALRLSVLEPNPLRLFSFSSFKAIPAIVEMLIYYCFLFINIKLLFNLHRLPSSEVKDLVLFNLLFMMFLFLMHGYFEANYGTILRKRVLIYPFLMINAALFFSSSKKVTPHA